MGQVDACLAQDGDGDHTAVGKASRPGHGRGEDRGLRGNPLNRHRRTLALEVTSGDQVVPVVSWDGVMVGAVPAADRYLPHHRIPRGRYDVLETDATVMPGMRSVPHLPLIPGILTVSDHGLVEQ